MKRIACVSTAWCLAMALPAAVSAQNARSGPLARELSALLVAHKESVVAAKDPETADRFMAAMVFPNVELLVVSARYAASSVLQKEVDNQEYYDVYALLRQASIPNSRVFFQDLKADGLHAKPDHAIDVMYERGMHETVFDGAPEKRHITEAAYEEKFREADTLYSHCLSVLIGKLTNSARTR